MKQAIIAAWVIVVLALTGCAAAAPQAASSAGTTTSDAIVVSEESLGMKNALLIGLYRLEGAGQPLSQDQAEALATLWEAYKGVSESATSTSEETEALLNQMQATLTDEQIAAINAMALGSDDLAPFYADLGIELPTPVPGETPRVPGGGSGQTLTEEEKAARREASGNTAGASRATLVIDEVIAYLRPVQ